MNFGARDGGCILWDCFPSGWLGTAAGEEKPGEYDRIYSTIDFREETGHHRSWYSPASGPPVAAGEQNIEVWNEVSGSMGHFESRTQRSKLLDTLALLSHEELSAESGNGQVTSPGASFGHWWQL